LLDNPAKGSIHWLSKVDDAEPEDERPDREEDQQVERRCSGAFVARKTEIDAMLTRLQTLSDDHFGYSPDEVTWDHVGTLEHHAELLKRITDMACNEGDHAA
jgi:hypothetical protein